MPRNKNPKRYAKRETRIVTNISILESDLNALYAIAGKRNTTISAIIGDLVDHLIQGAELTQEQLEAGAAARDAAKVARQKRVIPDHEKNSEVADRDLAAYKGANAPSDSQEDSDYLSDAQKYLDYLSESQEYLDYLIARYAGDKED